MKYHLKIIRKAQKDLDDIRGKDSNAITKKILSLVHSPRPFGCIKLTDDDDYRIRVGRFRILYRINENVKEIIIYRIKQRKDAYR